jgi:hypothetical protein
MRYDEPVDNGNLPRTVFFAFCGKAGTRKVRCSMDRAKCLMLCTGLSTNDVQVNTNDVQARANNVHVKSALDGYLMVGNINFKRSHACIVEPTQNHPPGCPTSEKNNLRSLWRLPSAEDVIAIRGPWPFGHLSARVDFVSCMSSQPAFRDLASHFLGRR